MTFVFVLYKDVYSMGDFSAPLADQQGGFWQLMVWQSSPLSRFPSSPCLFPMCISLQLRDCDFPC